MSSSHAVGASGVPAHVVPLPPRPNLEFERKRARQVLRAIQGGEPEALDRIRRVREGIQPGAVKLADVHLSIAREYGFSSWPRLVSYFETWERHAQPGPQTRSYGREHYEMRVQHLLRSHSGKTAHSAQLLATFVPRFYARSDAEIFASPITEAEAQLAVARLERYSNWNALIESADREKPPSEPPADRDAHVRSHRVKRYGVPLADALAAIDMHDTAVLSALLDRNPEMLAVEDRSGFGMPMAPVLIRLALDIELERGDAASRAVTDLLIARGADVVSAATAKLLTGISVKASYIAQLLDRGADPNRTPLAGVPLLDWAIMRYWNPEAVDLIAAKVKARPAFWIAAGLGDVQGTLRFLDRDGKPTEAARSDRPDFILASFPMPCRPEADDLEIIWEAFTVAGFNQRLEVIDALLNRGFPIDYDRWGSTLLKWALGNSKEALASHLRNRGARS